MQNQKPSISAADFEKLYESLKNWGRWGGEDNKGTLNYITPEKIISASSLVKSGVSISMSIPIDKTAGPDNPHPAIHYMSSLHDIDTGSRNQQGFATDFLGMQFHGDCHTHIDSLCHISYRGLLYNGIRASTVNTNGAEFLDVTAYANGIISRGLLIDVPRFRGVKWLEPGESITRDEIEAIEKAYDIRLEKGDIMLLRTGQYLRRLEKGPWNVGHDGEGRAGIDPYCMTLLHERQVAVFFPEGDGEVAPSYVEGQRSPIHVLQVNAMGMCVADSLQLEDVAEFCATQNRYECMVVAAPLRLPNGTGCPFNPIAIF